MTIQAFYLPSSYYRLIILVYYNMYIISVVSYNQCNIINDQSHERDLQQ